MTKPRRVGLKDEVTALRETGLRPVQIARRLECTPSYVSQVLNGDRAPARHYGPRQAQPAKRDKPKGSKLCGRNILNRQTGRVETCAAPRLRLGGETMGCCKDCYERTRPLGSINSSYGRI